MIRGDLYENIHIKRIIVAIASVSLLLTTAFFSGCDDGKNYEEEIANLQAQIDQLKKEHEQFAAEHKEILDKLENSETDGTTDEDETGSTTTGNGQSLIKDQKKIIAK